MPTPEPPYKCTTSAAFFNQARPPLHHCFTGNSPSLNPPKPQLQLDQQSPPSSARSRPSCDSTPCCRAPHAGPPLLHMCSSYMPVWGSHSPHQQHHIEQLMPASCSSKAGPAISLPLHSPRACCCGQAHTLGHHQVAPARQALPQPGTRAPRAQAAGGMSARTLIAPAPASLPALWQLTSLTSSHQYNCYCGCRRRCCVRGCCSSRKVGPPAPWCELMRRAPAAAGGPARTWPWSGWRG